MGASGRAAQVIARAGELERVHAFVERLLEGPAGLLIHGEAGIGKTSVWLAALDAAEAAGMRILRSAPAESEQQLTLGGLTDLLADVSPDDLAALPGIQRHALEIALLRTEPTGQLPDQRTLSVATATLLRSLATDRPLMIAIDDAQWLDATSGGVIAYALRRLTDRPAGVLLAVRGMPPARILELAAGVPSDRRDRLNLGPMPLGGLHQLFLARLGRSFPRLVLVRIEAASAGNPFYALEIARALQEGQPVLTPGEPLPIPESLGALVEARISTLHGPTRQALLFAAIAAEPTLDSLERAHPGAAAALEPAVEAGIVQLEGRFIRFAHPLLATAVIATTSAAELRSAHAVLARTARSGDARARHLAGATEGRHENVAAALESAAAAARNRGATLDAASLYERAADLTPEGHPDDAVRRAALAAECLFVDISEVVQAGTLLQRAIEHAPPVPALAEALSLAALIRYYHGDTPGAVQLADRALAGVGEAVVPAGRPAASVHRARVLARAAFVVMQLDLRRGFALAAEAVRLLDPEPPGIDPDLLANVLLLHASGAIGLVEGMPEEEIKRGLGLISKSGRSWEHEGADGIAFGLTRLMDDLDRAIAMTHDLIRAKAGPGGDDPFNLVQLSGLQLLRGDMADARASAGAAAEGYAREGADIFPSWRLRGLALVAAYEGRHDEARRLAIEGLDLATHAGDLTLEAYHRHILGFVALAAGDMREAHEQLERAAEAAAATGTRHPGRFKLDGDRIEAALAVGDLDLARNCIEWLEHVNDVAPTRWTQAIGSRGRALVRASEGDLGAAAGALEEAMGHHDRLPMPFERARTLLALGQVRRRRKEKRLADAHLREALRGFEALGATAWADRARTELGRVGLRPRASSELTETERRVAELAATGLSSREIGEVAFLAPKTVGNVLGRVYGKLGIHSRAELGSRIGEGSLRGHAGDRSG